MALVAVTAYVPRTEPRLGLLLVALVFGAVNLPCVALWALMGVKLRKLLNKPKALRSFNIAMALLLVASLYWVVTGEGA
jgi:threonine/homoserine/homoserine lactone efflux protein